MRINNLYRRMMKWKTRLSILLLCLVFVPDLFGVEAVRIAGDEQLFLDEDFIIEKQKNVTGRVCQAEKYGPPVLRPDKPWEKDTALIFGSVMYDSEESLFKMWYYCNGADFAYAASKDGIHWDKPELDLHLYEGCKTNILVKRLQWDYNYEIIGVYKDLRDPDPKRRYKMGFVSLQKPYEGPHTNRYRPKERAGFGTAYSPDGIHYELGNLYATEEVCDISHFFYDPKNEEFVLHGRCKLSSDMLGTRFAKNGWGRAVVHLTSKDFDHWSPGEFVYAAERTDPADTEIYSISTFPYGNLYIHLIQMYYAPEGRLDYQAGFSHNGKDIVRIEPRIPFLAEGSVGQWDRFNISLGNLPPVSVGDEWWFYYGGRTYRHPPYKGEDTRPQDAPYPRAQIGLAKVKRGRIYALEAGFDEGWVLTRPLLFTGGKLYVNANTAYGAMGVSIRDENDEKIEGATKILTGIDGVDIPVEFDNFDSSSLAGKAVKIRFVLQNARIYGFHIK